MPDREKLIEQLENEAMATDKGYVEIPLFMFSEIIALLKEPDAVHVELEGGGSSWWYVCEECHSSVQSYDRYCHECGRRLLF